MKGPRWRPITEGWGLLLPLVLAGLATAITRPRLAIGPLLGAAAVWLAFRDPERRPPADPHLALAPADGFVTRIGRAWEPRWSCEMTEIAIFLALWDVHVQRSPLDAEVLSQEIRPGRFLPAFGRRAARANTQVATYLQSGYGPCVVTQISGLVARRIVTWAKPGDRLARGARLGMIKFGSQVTVRLPRGVVLLVTPGALVRAGLTPLADCAAGDGRRADRAGQRTEPPAAEA